MKNETNKELYNTLSESVSKEDLVEMFPEYNNVNKTSIKQRLSNIKDWYTSNILGNISAEGLTDVFEKNGLFVVETGWFKKKHLLFTTPVSYNVLHTGPDSLELAKAIENAIVELRDMLNDSECDVFMHRGFITAYNRRNPDVNSEYFSATVKTDGKAELVCFDPEIYSSVTQWLNHIYKLLNISVNYYISVDKNTPSGGVYLPEDINEDKVSRHIKSTLAQTLPKITDLMEELTSRKLVPEKYNCKVGEAILELKNIEKLIEESN